MSLTPEQVARVTPPIGSDWDIAKNRDHVTTGTAGKLTEHDLTATTTGREGLWMGYSLIAGAPVDHGEVADEAAMLALHNWAADPLSTSAYHYVAPGDSCTRTDDPGYRWHCLAGHGISPSQWERRPLGDTVSDLVAEFAEKIGSASLDGFEPDLGNPDSDGMVLASTAAGVRSWIEPSTGGGTTLPTPTVGQMLYCTTAGTWSALAAPSQGQILTGMTAGANVVPMWVTPAVPWQAQVARWIARAEAAGGTFTAASQGLADDLITALNTKPYAGKILALYPHFGGNLATALIPLVDQYNAGPMVNTAFVNADFSEATGLQGAAGKQLNSNYLLNACGPSGAVGFGTSLRTIGGQSWQMGYNTGSTLWGACVSASYTSYLYWSTANSNTAGAGAVGSYYVQRPAGASATVGLAKDGTVIRSLTGTAAGPAAPIYFMGIGNASLYHSLCRHGYSYITDGTLTAGEQADLITLLADYIITPTGR